MAGAIYQTKLTADTSQHDQALGKSAKQVLNYKKSCEQADKGVSNFLGGLKKLAPALGVATVAGKLFKSMLANNTEAADNFGSIIQTCKSITNEFAYSLSTMDFSTMYNGLGNLISRAREYYNEFDKLQTLTINLTGANAKLDAQLAEARRRFKEGDKSAAEDIKRIGDQQLANMRAEQAQIAKVQEAAVRTATQAVASNGRYKASAEINWGMEKIKEYTEDMNKLDAAIWDAEKRYKALNKQAGEYNSDNIIHFDAAKAESEYKALVRLKKRYSDDDNLKAFNEEYAKYWRLEQQWNQTQQRNLRYLQEGVKTDKLPKLNTMKVEVEPELPAGSIAALEKEIQSLKGQYDLATTDDNRNILLEKIKAAEKELENLKIDPSSIAPAGSMAKLEEELGALKVNWRLATTDEKRAEIKTAIDAIQAEIDKMNGVVVEVEVKTPKEYLQEQINQLRRQMELADDAGVQIKIGFAIDELNKQMEKLDESLKTPAERIQDRVDAIQKQFEELGDTCSNACDLMADALGAFSLAGDEAAQQTMKTAASIMSAVGQAIPKILALVSAQEADAISGAVASGAKLPFPANIAAITTVVAQVMAALSPIISLMAQARTFAGGGVFDGFGPKYGDMHIARVNPGEMILNESQQARLFSMLNGSIGPQGTGGGQVEFVIRGADLVGVLSNRDRQIKRVR